MLAVAAAHPAVAQTSETAPAYRARVLGVFDLETGKPIQGADVTDVFSRTSARTTATGTVSLVFLPDGGSLVKVQKLGFEATTIIVAISPVDTTPFTVLLRPAAAQTLPAVVTKDSTPHHIAPGLTAFEERRRLGFGRFLGEVELRKNDNRSMTDVVRSMGVKVNCQSIFPIQCFATSSRVGCALQVFRDGILINVDGRDLEKMNTSEFGAVEVYDGPATIPALYNRTGSSCGVMLLWTRER